MQTLRKLFTSKYLLTGIAFAIWMLFFDRNDIPLQAKRVSELHKLNQSEVIMETRIANTRKELSQLKTNPETLEKYAREKFLMKKDNEDLFIITEDSSLTK